MYVSVCVCVRAGGRGGGFLHCLIEVLAAPPGRQSSD